MTKSEHEQLKLDAARWRALVNSPALIRNSYNTMSKELVSNNFNAYLHIELSVKPASWAVDSPPPNSNKEQLTRFADQAIKQGNNFNTG